MAVGEALLLIASAGVSWYQEREAARRQYRENVRLAKEQHRKVLSKAMFDGQRITDDQYRRLTAAAQASKYKLRASRYFGSHLEANTFAQRVSDSVVRAQADTIAEERIGGYAINKARANAEKERALRLARRAYKARKRMAAISFVGNTLSLWAHTYETSIDDPSPKKSSGNTQSNTSNKTSTKIAPNPKSPNNPPKN